MVNNDSRSKYALYQKILTRIWVLLCLLSLLWIIFNQPTSFPELWYKVEVSSVYLSALLIVAGKLLTIALVFFTLKIYGEDRGVTYAWRAYSIADIAKYLPGGVWGIAGRLAVYKGSGISLKKSGAIFMLESALILIFSFFVGLAFLLPAMFHFSAYLEMIILLSLLGGVLGLTWILAKRPGFYFLMAISFSQVLAWVFFGLSFALIAMDIQAFDLLYWSGVFDISFSMGMLAFFAPSGIGVREAIVSLFSAHVANNPIDFVELALVHRAIWLIADLVVLLPTFRFKVDKIEQRF